MMKTHRMAIFISSHEGDTSSCQMLALAAGLTHLGHEVDLVVQRADETLLNALAHGVRLVELGAYRHLPSALALARYLSRHKPRVLMSSGLQANLIALKAGHLSGGRVPVVIHHAQLPSVQLKALGDKSGSLRRKMALHYSRAVMALSTDSEMTREMIREGGIADARVTQVDLPRDDGSDVSVLTQAQLMQCLARLLTAAGIVPEALQLQERVTQVDTGSSTVHLNTRLGPSPAQGSGALEVGSTLDTTRAHGSATALAEHAEARD